MQGDKILYQNASLFSLWSGFNHLPWAHVGSATPISWYFYPLNPKYSEECIIQNWKFWKFLISKSNFDVKHQTSKSKIKLWQTFTSQCLEVNKDLIAALKNLRHSNTAIGTKYSTEYINCYTILTPVSV